MILDTNQAIALLLFKQPNIKVKIGSYIYWYEGQEGKFFYGKTEEERFPSVILQSVLGNLIAQGAKMWGETE